MKRNRNIYALFFSLVALLLAACVVVLLLFQASRAARAEQVMRRDLVRRRVLIPLQKRCGRMGSPVQVQQCLQTFGAPHVRATFMIAQGRVSVFGLKPQEAVEAGAFERAIAGLEIAKAVKGRARLVWNVENVSVGTRSCQVAWISPERGVRRKLDKVQVVGCVVEFGRSPLAEGTAGIYLVVALVVGLALFSLVVVWQLVRAARRADAEAALKTRFVANYAHELKTPLASLLLRAEMLQDGRYAAEGKRARALGVIVEEGRRLNAMVLNLLDLIRIECRSVKYVREPFDLSETARAVTETMRPFFAANGLEVDAPEALPVRADPGRVREILENLLSNAAKYAAAAGPVSVEARRAGEWAVLRVVDRGAGLAPEQLRCVFMEYWRADDGLTRETGGSGIGLFISREYARGMGGRLSVSSVAGAGCTFTFELPLDVRTEEA